MSIGIVLALVGAVLAATLAGLGSAKAVGIVGQASAGLLAENPTVFGKALVLQALPGTQGIYGLITAFMLINKLGLLSGAVPAGFTVEQGLYYFAACMPIAIVGYFSAIHQGRVAASGINLLAKRPNEVGKALTSAALVETYAIFAVLVSLLTITNGI